MADSLSGRLLIASPWIGDPRFERTLILLCKHSKRGAMGLVVNKPLDGLTLPEILDQMGIACTIQLDEYSVLNGGPVNRDRGFVLHSDDYFLEDSTHSVIPGVSLTATKEVLIAMGSENSPRQATLALGYASWTGGQLEGELEQNAWLLCDGDQDLIFDPQHDHKWRGALDRIGVDPARYGSSSGHC